MLYSIDLFRGTGVPAKSKPEGIAATVITVVIPLLIAISMAGIYFTNKVVIKIDKAEIANFQRKIEEFAEEMADYKSRCQFKDSYEGYLSEASSSLSKHDQWSEILVAVVGNMPETLVLNKLSVQENNVRVNVPDSKNPKKKVVRIVPARTLSMKLEGTSGDETDKAVKEFRKRLQNSPVLRSKVEDMPVSHEEDVEDGHNMINYELKCIFKPQI